METVGVASFSLHVTVRRLVTTLTLSASESFTAPSLVSLAIASCALRTAPSTINERASTLKVADGDEAARLGCALTPHEAEAAQKAPVREWIHHQIAMPPTLHRAYWRARTNPRLATATVPMDSAASHYTAPEPPANVAPPRV